jgi:GT2 family glycosyltransferase
MHRRPHIAVCIPHWQVQNLITVCLRSIRKHSAKYDLEVVVVDNGSLDGSLDYLRSVDWIRLIERPDEVHTNWPGNVFTAWDLVLRQVPCDYYLGMHSDVFIKCDNWLDPFLREINAGPRVASAGSWKLELRNPFYMWQKHVVGYGVAKVKSLFGRKRHVTWKQGHYPRDYCALFRPDILLRHELTFGSVNGWACGGYSIARQLWRAGYETRTFPVREMDRLLAHVTHGTAAVKPEKPLNHRWAQKKAERRAVSLFDQPWVRELLRDDSLDRRQRRAA